MTDTRGIKAASATAAILCATLSYQPAGAQFTTVINVPPDTAPAQIFSDTQLNLTTGGSIDSNFFVGAFDGSSTNIEVNITGGLISESFRAAGDATINISGDAYVQTLQTEEGVVVNVTGNPYIHFLRPHQNSTANVYGGVLEYGIRASADGVFNLYGGIMGRADTTLNSQANLFGGSFELDGVPVAGLVSNGDTVHVNLGSESVLTGILTDGTPIALSNLDRQETITDGTLSLILAPIPAPGFAVINVPSDPAPNGLTPGQTLNLATGGMLADHFTAIGSTLNITGGNVGENLELVNTHATLSDGSIGHGLGLFHNSSLTVNGGGVGGFIDLAPNTTLTLNDGFIDGAIEAHHDAQLNILGGKIAGGLHVMPGSNVTMTGGIMGDNLDIDGGDIEVHGGIIYSAAKVRFGGTLTMYDGYINPGLYVNNLSYVNLHGGSIYENFDLNQSTMVMTGGEIGDEFNVAALSHFTLSGGVIADDMAANLSTLELQGGAIGLDFVVINSTVTLAGGSIGQGFNTLGSTALAVHGAEFLLDGVPVAGLGVPGATVSLNLPNGSILSGTLTDGSVFLLSSLAGDQILDGTLTLVADTVPAYHPNTIHLPADPAPNGLRFGESLHMSAGASLDDDFGMVGATATVEGGTIGQYLQLANTTLTLGGGSIDKYLVLYDGAILNVDAGAVGDHVTAHNNTTLNIQGGSVGKELQALPGSTVNISAGSLSYNVEIHEGSVINISGGSVGNNLHALSGGTINISGGVVGNSMDVGSYNQTSTNVNAEITGGIIGPGLRIHNGATTTIRGGSIGRSVDTFTGSTLNLHGEFYLDGLPLTTPFGAGGSQPFDIPAGSQLIAILADGSLRAFGDARNDQIVSGTLVLHDNPAAPPAPIINAPTDPIPHGLRPGQTLNLYPTGDLGHYFTAFGATINIQGGSTGQEMHLYNTTLNLDSGNIDRRLHARDGSIVNVNGGSIADYVEVFGGSTLNVNAGQIGDQLLLHAGSTLHLTGGAIGEDFQAGDGSDITITGGLIGDGFQAPDNGRITIGGGGFEGSLWIGPNSEFNILGGSFTLDGLNITSSLTPGVPRIITDRDVELTGLFSDGSVFSFALDTKPTYPRFLATIFDTNAIVTVTLLPMPGDLNHDGFVGIADLNIVLGAWNQNVSSGDWPSGDLNGDGFVGIVDLTSVLGNWNAGTPPIDGVSALPEPSTAILLLIGGILCLPRHNGS